MSKTKAASLIEQHMPVGKAQKATPEGEPEKISVQTVKLKKSLHVRLGTYGLHTSQSNQAMIVKAIEDFLDKHGA